MCGAVRTQRDQRLDRVFFLRRVALRLSGAACTGGFVCVYLRLCLQLAQCLLHGGQFIAGAL